MSATVSTGWGDRVVLITGGTAGLGRSLVGSFARRGARVIVWARDPDRLADLEAEARAAGWQVEGVRVDITDESSVERAKQQLLARYGRLDVLINNVGKSTRCDVASSTLAQYRDLMEVNFFALVRCTLSLADELIRRGGHVVNIGSLASKTAWPFVAPYATSKFAVAAFTQQLRLETPRALHVMLVCPGPIRRTDGGTRYRTESRELPAEAGKPGAGAPMKGLDPDRLAEAIVRGCERRSPELILPRWPRLLFALGQLSAGLGDWMIHRLKGTRRPDRRVADGATADPIATIPDHASTKEPSDEDAASPV
ncbi:MAG TPA: hypothetical protein DCQ98_14730 [Planctomycetaceae bacterium]|nr:hypothetical protein [Planctomycetaceae bacterium]HRF00978.1 SDR family NAD(P)-dependent oxidoreductase [Pirellulaceae bacterium]